MQAAESALRLMEQQQADTEALIREGLRAAPAFEFLRPVELLVRLVRDSLRILSSAPMAPETQQAALDMLAVLLDQPDPVCRSTVYVALAQQPWKSLEIALAQLDLSYYICTLGLADAEPSCRAAALAILRNMLANAPAFMPQLRALAPVLQAYFDAEEIGPQLSRIFMQWVEACEQPAEALLLGSRALLHRARVVRQWGCAAVHRVLGVMLDAEALAFEASHVDAYERAASVGWRAHTVQDAASLLQVLSDAPLGLNLRASAAEQVSGGRGTSHIQVFVDSERKKNIFYFLFFAISFCFVVRVP